MGLRITTRHVFTIPGFSTRRGFCRDKSREWAKRQGLDWDAFKRDGLDEQVFLDIGDAFAIALVEWAHKYEAEAKARNDG